MILDLSKNDIFTIEVETTPSCNFSCEYCINKQHLSFDENKKFNINFDMLFQFISQLNIKKKIQIILNGGEPTLHPKLLLFLQQCKLKQIHVDLLTNLSASIQLYQAIKNTNTKIIPTYHFNQISINEFKQKINELNLNIIYVPIYNEIELNEIKNAFSNYKVKFQLIENFKYTNEMFKLLSIDLSLKKQIQILQRNNQFIGKNHICKSLASYMYINGDGNIYRCMFNENTKLGNINSISSWNYVLKHQSFVCNNSYCYYKFD